jgi:hypothetical protein
MLDREGAQRSAVAYERAADTGQQRVLPAAPGK